MRWIELSSEVDREAVEPVSAIFQREGRGGVIVEEPILPTGEWGGWETDPSKPVFVRTYLPVGRGVKAKRERIERALWHLGQIRSVSPLQVRDLDDIDWADAWKQHYDVHRIGKRTVIKPSWRTFDPNPDDVVVELDPGMAFGTGLHPTTRLCVAALETLVKPDDKVLDFGCGSGILTIAALKLGAADALAIDVDSVAVAATAANCAANGLDRRVRVLQCSVDRVDEQFDITLANISGKIVISNAAQLANVVRSGGSVLASGFLDATEVEVALALASQGFRIVASAGEQDWRLLHALRDLDDSAEA